jgi:transcriptional regulator with XRE-family HTH domain
MGNIIKRLLEAGKKSGEYYLENARLDFTVGINAIMQEKSISKTKLAELIKTSPAYITKIFRGENFTLATMVKIAHALGAKIQITVSPIQEKSIPLPSWTPISKPDSKFHSQGKTFLWTEGENNDEQTPIPA